MKRTERIVSDITELLDLACMGRCRGDGPNGPLISPWSTRRMSEILNIDIENEPYQVPNIKNFLKTFLIQYRLDGGLGLEEIESCFEMIEDERGRHNGETTVENDRMTQLYCSDCGHAGSCFCVNCLDVYCSSCSQRIHSKGARRFHKINDFMPCVTCKKRPARILCTFSFRTFCMDCFERHESSSAACELLDLRPVTIDYGSRETGAPNDLHAELVPHGCMRSDIPRKADHEWHPFLDASGVVYYYNFRTKESKRRNHDLSPLPDPHAVKRQEQAVKRVMFSTGPAYVCNLFMLFIP